MICKYASRVQDFPYIVCSAINAPVYCYKYDYIHCCNYKSKNNEKKYGILNNKRL